jgi:coenzyme PQQ precursor peptide PqqA
LTPLWPNLNVTRSRIFGLCLPEQGRSQMKWTTPRIVEIAIGLEINSYACAELK